MHPINPWGERAPLELGGWTIGTHIAGHGRYSPRMVYTTVPARGPVAWERRVTESGETHSAGHHSGWNVKGGGGTH